MSSEKDEMSADAGIRTRVLTLARLSDNQLHYVHTGKAWIHSSNINITDDGIAFPIYSNRSDTFRY